MRAGTHMRQWFVRLPGFPLAPRQKAKQLQQILTLAIQRQSRAPHDREKGEMSGGSSSSVRAFRVDRRPTGGVEGSHFLISRPCLNVLGETELPCAESELSKASRLRQSSLIHSSLCSGPELTCAAVSSSVSFSLSLFSSFSQCPNMR